MTQPWPDQKLWSWWMISWKLGGGHGDDGGEGAKAKVVEGFGGDGGGGGGE